MDNPIEEIRCSRDMMRVKGIDEVDEDSCLLIFDDEEEMLVKGSYSYFFYICNGFSHQFMEN